MWTSYKIDACLSRTHARVAYMKAPYSIEELQIIESMGILANQAFLTTKEVVEKAHQDVDDARTSTKQGNSLGEVICFFVFERPN